MDAMLSLAESTVDPFAVIRQYTGLVRHIAPLPEKDNPVARATAHCDAAGQRLGEVSERVNELKDICKRMRQYVEQCDNLKKAPIENDREGRAARKRVLDELGKNLTRLGEELLERIEKLPTVLIDVYGEGPSHSEISHEGGAE